MNDREREKKDLKRFHTSFISIQKLRKRKQKQSLKREKEREKEDREERKGKKDAKRFILPFSFLISSV